MRFSVCCAMRSARRVDLMACVLSTRQLAESPWTNPRGMRACRYALGVLLGGERCVLSIQKGSNMNTCNYGEQEFNYSSYSPEQERSQTPPSHVRRSKHPARRRVKAPSLFNVMHRRRRKRIKS